MFSKLILVSCPRLYLASSLSTSKPGYAGERHHLGWVVVQGSIYGAVVQSDVDVIIKALGRLQCITLDLCLSRALEDPLIGVVAYPPIARCWDLEDHQLGGVSGDTGQASPVGELCGGVRGNQAPVLWPYGAHNLCSWCTAKFAWVRRERWLGLWCHRYADTPAV